MRIHRWLSFGLLTVATFAGGALLLQRQIQSDLHAQLEQLREGQRQLAQVQAEHERLQKLRVPEAELERLRADHAALVRLRAEVGELKARLEERQRAAESAAQPGRAPAAVSVPAFVFNVGLGADGNLLVDGSPSNLALLEQRLAGLVRGTRVAVRLATEPSQLEKASQTARRLMAIAKEHGLRIEVKYAVAGR